MPCDGEEGADSPVYDIDRLLEEAVRLKDCQLSLKQKEFQESPEFMRRYVCVLSIVLVPRVSR